MPPVVSLVIYFCAAMSPCDASSSSRSTSHSRTATVAHADGTLVLLHSLCPIVKNIRPISRLRKRSRGRQEAYRRYYGLSRKESQRHDAPSHVMLTKFTEYVDKIQSPGTYKT